MLHKFTGLKSLDESFLSGYIRHQPRAAASLLRRTCPTAFLVTRPVQIRFLDWHRCDLDHAIPTGDVISPSTAIRNDAFCWNNLQGDLHIYMHE